MCIGVVFIFIEYLLKDLLIVSTQSIRELNHLKIINYLSKARFIIITFESNIYFKSLTYI